MGVRTSHTATRVGCIGAIAAAIFGSGMGIPVPALAHSVKDDVANALLAHKLHQLSQALDMKDGRYADSIAGGGKSVDADSQNTFLSNDSYHSKTQTTCLDGNIVKCARALPPYISQHGLKSDRSKLEEVVWNNYAPTEGQGPQQDGNSIQYAIWNIKTRGGSIIDRNGKFDDRNITSWNLKPEVRQQVENVGEQTAQRNIDATLDTNRAGAPTMTSMESLRMMAERWSDMYRNRLLSNLGQQRVSRKPIEFALAENRPTCDSYLNAIRNQRQRPPGGDRLISQTNLAVETRTRDLEQRYNLCQQMLQANASMVNPQVTGGGVQEGSPDTEAGAEWRTRVNLAVFDAAGLDPNSVPHPNDVQLTRPEYANNLKKYDAGGVTYKTVSMTNAEQLRGYNQALASAAEGVKAAAARNPYMVDYSQAVVSNAIAPGSRGITDINSMTSEMRHQLASTGLPLTAPADYQNDPAKHHPNTPAGLVVTRLQ